jgi:hypothetical protein
MKLIKAQQSPHPSVRERHANQTQPSSGSTPIYSNQACLCLWFALERSPFVNELYRFQRKPNSSTINENIRTHSEPFMPLDISSRRTILTSQEIEYSSNMTTNDHIGTTMEKTSEMMSTTTQKTQTKKISTDSDSFTAFGLTFRRVVYYLL